MSSDYAIIILAAGASRRLGNPKQLVDFKGDTLLNHSINAAKKIPNTDLYVILGSQFEKIFLTMPKVKCFVNPKWERGMGDTISFSVQAIAHKKYKGMVFTTCDQPYLNTSILKNILKGFEQSKKKIIVSKYENGQGIPSFFSNNYFNQLIKLKGDDGAKAIIKNNLGDVGFVEFEKGDIDIDTRQDLKKIKTGLIK